ncbi:MAG: SRPBCC family protein [Microbacteriaceae bacterium]
MERMLEIDRSDAEVWQLLRLFGGITHWMKGADGMQFLGDEGVPGAKRIFPQVEGADPLIEELISVDDADQVLKYCYRQFPHPMKEHRAAISVTDNHDGSSTVLWHIEFETDAETEPILSEYFSAEFESGLQGLEEFYQNQN